MKNWSEVAKKAWKTRKANEKFRILSARAKKAVRTKKKNGLNFSKVAKKAWKTRRFDLKAK